MSEPQLTVATPFGLIVPPAPADAVIVYVFSVNDAAIVWLACAFKNV